MSKPSVPVCLVLLFVPLGLLFGQQPQKPTGNPNGKPLEESRIAPPLSVADSLKTMKIQPGYRLVPVLTEPHIHEPAAIAWDGNGRMYVVEMRTYMQDIDGKNQLAPVRPAHAPPPM